MSQPLYGSSSGSDSTSSLKDEPGIYIFFDPGKSTGIATFDHKGELIDSFQKESIDELIEWCSSFTWLEGVKGIGYEDFLLDPRTPQGGSNMPACIAIGVIRFFAHKLGAPICTKRNGKIQTRLDKATGYGWWGKPVAKKSDPLNHQKDAVAHGVFWLVTMGIRKTNLERRKGGNN